MKGSSTAFNLTMCQESKAKTVIIKVNMFPHHTCAHAVHTYVAIWNDVKENWYIADDDGIQYETRRQMIEGVEHDNLEVLEEFLEDVDSADFYHFAQTYELSTTMKNKNLKLTEDSCLNKVMFCVPEGAKSGEENGMKKKAQKTGRGGPRVKKVIDDQSEVDQIEPEKQNDDNSKAESDQDEVNEKQTEIVN